LGEEVGGFRIFQTAANCITHYLHGALHLFLGDQLETRKRIVTNTTIVEDIALTIRATKRMPLFVAEGSTSQKMARINAVLLISGTLTSGSQVLKEVCSFLAIPPQITTGISTTQSSEAKSVICSFACTVPIEIGRPCMTDLRVTETGEGISI
jgi:hypothetical protein